MRNPYLSFFFVLSYVMLCLNIYPVLAKAPDTPKIVFSAYRDENRDIYLMNPDGTDQVNITQNKALDGYPIWSPTGEHILFASDRGGVLDLYLMKPDGSNVRRVFGKEADRSGATWSPDGKQITYRRRKPSGSFVYIAPIDGKSEEEVAFGASPAWSPDGEEIAFLTGWPERMQITILNVSTRKQKVLFPRPVRPSWMTAPAWSPSGNKIAFTWVHKVPLGQFADTETIYTINRDGTGLQQIIDEEGSRATSPVWSPRGDTLLYNRYVKGKPRQIYKIGLNGGVSVRLTNPKFWHFVGDWFDPAFALSISPQTSLLTTVWGQVKSK